MKALDFDNLEPEVKLEIYELRDRVEALTKACKRSLSALEWCHQWLQGDDAKEIDKDIKTVKRVLQQAKVE